MSERSTEQVLREALRRMVAENDAPTRKYGERRYAACQEALSALALPDSGDHRLAETFRANRGPVSPPQGSTSGPNVPPMPPLSKERVEELARDLCETESEARPALWTRAPAPARDYWMGCSRRLLMRHPEFTRAEVSPSCAARLYDDLQQVEVMLEPYIDSSSTVRFIVDRAELIDWEARIAAVQKALLATRDAAPEAPRPEPVSTDRATAGEKPRPHAQTAGKIPLADLRQMLDRDVEHMERRGRKLTKHLRRELRAGAVPIEAVDDAEILAALTQRRQVYVDLLAELAILYPARQRTES